MGTASRRDEICSQEINLLTFTVPEYLDTIFSSRNLKSAIAWSWKHVLSKRSLSPCPVTYILSYVSTVEQVTSVCPCLYVAVNMLKAVRFPSQELKSGLAKHLSGAYPPSEGMLDLRTSKFHFDPVSCNSVEVVRECIYLSCSHLCAVIRMWQKGVLYTSRESKAETRAEPAASV